MVQPRIRVLLCDASELYRVGVRSVLGNTPDLVVVAESRDVAGALAVIRRVQPDVVVVDLDLPGGGALDIVCTAVQGGCRVLSVAADLNADTAAEAIRAGAGGYLPRDLSAAQLAATVRLVFHGVAVLAGPVARELGTRRAAGPPAYSDGADLGVIAGLTDRQLEVFRLVANGLTNAEIAGRLHVSEATVKSHMSALLRKLELRDRTQLVVFAHRRVEESAPGCER